MRRWPRTTKIFITFCTLILVPTAINLVTGASPQAWNVLVVPLAIVVIAAYVVWTVIDSRRPAGAPYSSDVGAPSVRSLMEVANKLAMIVQLQLNEEIHTHRLKDPAPVQIVWWLRRSMPRKP